MVQTERSPEEIRAILAKLVALQEVDREIIQLKKQLAILPPKLSALDTRLAQEQQEIEDVSVGRTDSSDERRRLEREVRELNEEIEKHRMRLMEVKTNKEYAAVNHEIDMLRGKVDALETRILEILDEDETHSRRVKQARERLERVCIEVQEEKQRIEEQIRSKNEKMARLKVEQKRRRNAVPADVLATYDRLSERLPGDVVCPAVRNHCGGCHMTLVNQIMVEIRQMKRFVRCEGCLRIFTGEAEG